ncbi:hypothetical protein CTI12_AA368690 [Artemisia annua]|uniref:Uncharacterized protein n=1 Tax=Artemisia annua TaxID=35608 RepID=A0A2U1MKZ1_ARTAN|nr:hypothetical protein CTI12_AA368690 [Artemisia annua]
MKYAMTVAPEATRINSELASADAAAEGITGGRLPALVVCPEPTPVIGGVKSGVVSDSGVKEGVVFDSGAKAGDSAPGTVDELPGAGGGTKVAGPVHICNTTLT